MTRHIIFFSLKSHQFNLKAQLLTSAERLWPATRFFTNFRPDFATFDISLLMPTTVPWKSPLGHLHLKPKQREFVTYAYFTFVTHMSNHRTRNFPNVDELQFNVS